MKRAVLAILPRRGFRPDRETEEVTDRVERRFPDRFGDARPFRWAMTRKDARKALRSFIRER